MQARSSDNFGNDDASGWISDLVASKGTAALMEPIEKILSNSEKPEATVCSIALAASEVIAAGISGDLSSTPEVAQSWLTKKPGLFGKPPEIGKQHAIAARQAVNKIASNSELKELWQGSEGYDRWQSMQTTLIKKLNV